MFGTKKIIFGKKMKTIVFRKCIWFVWIICIVFIILMLIMSAYSIHSARKFCKEKRMQYLDINQQHFFDLKDNIICYEVEKEKLYCEDEIFCITKDNGWEINFYYFER